MRKRSGKSSSTMSLTRHAHERIQWYSKMMHCLVRQTLGRQGRNWNAPLKLYNQLYFAVFPSSFS